MLKCNFLAPHNNICCYCTNKLSFYYFFIFVIILYICMVVYNVVVLLHALQMRDIVAST